VRNDRFASTAGGFALASSVLWLLALAIYWMARDFTADSDTGADLVWSALILAAGITTFVATFGLRHRDGGALQTIGLVVLATGVLVSFISWAIPLWMGIQGVGMVLVTVAIWSKGVVPRPALVGYGSGMLIGSALFFLLTAMKTGTPDSYGDYPIAWGMGLTVGAGIVAAGLIGIGWRLRSEEAETSSRAISV
jgi:hypothetical protein